MMPWILAHFLGDYILQNDWQAIGKKKSSMICLIHVLLYLLPLSLCGMQWWQLLIIGLQHFAQDRTNFVMWFMKWKGSELFAVGPCAPWSIIVTDNILHITFIWMVTQVVIS